MWWEGLLTCSRVPVAAEGFRPRLSPPARIRVVAGQYGGTAAGDAPVAFINTQSFHSGARFVGSGACQRIQADWRGGNIVYGAILTIFPRRTSTTYTVVARSADYFLQA